MAPPKIDCYDNFDYNGGALTVVGYNLLGTEVDVYRIDELNSEPVLLRGGWAYEVENGEMLVVDPEVPLGETVVYEIVMMPNGRSDPLRQSVFSSQVRVYDRTEQYAPMFCEPVYLSDPLIPSFGHWFGLLSVDALTYPPRSELYDVLGRHAPVAVSQKRSTPRTSIKLLTNTLLQRANMLSMTREGRVLLFRNPDLRYPEHHWYVSVGALTEERILPDHRDPHRRWTIEVAVVDRPVGYLSLVKSQRSYDTLLRFEPDGQTPIHPDTYDGMYEDYTNYMNVLLGGRAASQSERGAGRTSRALSDLAYGEGRYPTVSAAETSWSLA